MSEKHYSIVCDESGSGFMCGYVRSGADYFVGAPARIRRRFALDHRRMVLPSNDFFSDSFPAPKLPTTVVNRFGAAAGVMPCWVAYGGSHRGSGVARTVSEKIVHVCFAPVLAVGKRASARRRWPLSPTWVVVEEGRERSAGGGCQWGTRVEGIGARRFFRSCGYFAKRGWFPVGGPVCLSRE